MVIRLFEKTPEICAHIQNMRINIVLAYEEMIEDFIKLYFFILNRLKEYKLQKLVNTFFTFHRLSHYCSNGNSNSNIFKQFDDNNCRNALRYIVTSFKPCLCPHEI